MLLTQQEFVFRVLKTSHPGPSSHSDNFCCASVTVLALSVQARKLNQLSISHPVLVCIFHTAKRDGEKADFDGQCERGFRELSKSEEYSLKCMTSSASGVTYKTLTDSNKCLQHNREIDKRVF